jgi:uncharacterized protein
MVYQKKFALITGSSSGIGKAIAEELARKKINLVLVALPQTGLEEVAKNIAEEHDVVALPLAIDLTSPDAAVIIFNWCRSQGIDIRILVNNAGMGNISLLEEAPIETLNTLILLNNHALTMLTCAFIGSMKRGGACFILNVGSLAAFLPIPRKAVYAATKSFVYAFSCSLRNELRGTEIKVSCLCPGHTVTSERVNQNFKNISYRGSLFSQTPQEVAVEAVEQMFRGKRRIIPGWPNKFLFLLWTCLPYAVTSAILIRIFNKDRQVPSPRPADRKLLLSLVHR